jgi:hypothetical protein
VKNVIFYKIPYKENKDKCIEFCEKNCHYVVGFKNKPNIVQVKRDGKSSFYSLMHEGYFSIYEQMKKMI